MSGFGKMYAQEEVIKETKYATRVALCIDGEWIEGELRDLSHNILPLPHLVKKGERYLIVVKEEK